MNWLALPRLSPAEVSAPCLLAALVSEPSEEPAAPSPAEPFPVNSSRGQQGERGGCMHAALGLKTSAPISGEAKRFSGCL